MSICLANYSDTIIEWFSRSLFYLLEYSNIVSHTTTQWNDQIEVSAVLLWTHIMYLIILIVHHILYCCNYMRLTFYVKPCGSISYHVCDWIIFSFSWIIFILINRQPCICLYRKVPCNY